MTIRPSPPFRDFEVSAILREVAEPGSGKSQFRRPLRLSKNRPSLFDGTWSDDYVMDPGNASWRERDYPFAIGDVLWCRETWAEITAVRSRGRFGRPDIAYFADRPSGPARNAAGIITSDGIRQFHFDSIKKRSSTQMPRWASRLTLEVVGVKVERLQSISEEDARAEGAYPCEGGFSFGGSPLAGTTAYGAFYCAWLRTYGLSSWSANPFVAAVQFRPHLVNVDLLRQREGGR